MTSFDRGTGTYSLAPNRWANVLAFPAPSVARFATLLVVLLVTGAFTGTWFYLEVNRSAYVEAVTTCEAQATRANAEIAPSTMLVPGQGLLDQCLAGVERERAAFMIAGVLLAGAAGLVVVLVAPWLVERRYKLKPLNPSAAVVYSRIAELAGELGLRRMPFVQIGHIGRDIPDAFTYGGPSDHRIALPNSMLKTFMRDRSCFEGIVRHELSHLRHGDVEWRQLARSAWYVLGPMLALPVLVAVAGPGRSLLSAYVWRAVVLAVVVQLVLTATLRVREYDVDLAATAGGWRANPWFGTVRGAIAMQQGQGKQPWYQRGPLTSHPTPAQRLAVLDHPEVAAAVTFTDGFVAAFLAATAAPLIFELSWTALAGGRERQAASAISALIAGGLLGLVVGLALIRGELVHRAAGARWTPVPVALGVGIGVPLGQIISLVGVGTGQVGGLRNPLWLLLSAGFAVGATMLSSAIAALLGDVAGRFRSARAAWVPTVIASAAAYSCGLWIARQAELLGDSMGRDWLTAWAVTALDSSLVLAAAVVLTITATVATIARGSVSGPTWLTAQTFPTGWTPAGYRLLTAVVAGLAAGWGGTAVVLANRLIRGSALTESEQVIRLYTGIWVTAVAATAVMAALSGLQPSRGPALALVAGPIASAGVLFGIVQLSIVQGVMPTLDTVAALTRWSLALSTALGMLLAATAIVGRRATSVRPAAAALASFGVAVVVSGAIAVAPELVIPITLLSS